LRAIDYVNVKDSANVVQYKNFYKHKKAAEASGANLLTSAAFILDDKNLIL